MIEHFVCLNCDRTNAEHVEIVEIVVFAQPEIVITDVTAAEYRSMAVCDQQLVVHAHVESLHLGNHRSGSPRNAALLPWVEKPQLDIRMAFDIGHECLLAYRQEIIDDQSHVYSALSRMNSAFQQ